ncbi:HAMP domain-containing sensor histidine kinase [Clostridium sp. D53t1_180928_C8]|uniref:sensor histidine kinase n=1 Tax=Clostridium sp. D53t1_180928_C8 TaxID=2787101 RepID=UPI0018AB5ACC|nr:HAMP domain-containing sensor histidine kinase [Clostridium sp. D53t1_180928_C8]
MAKGNKRKKSIKTRILISILSIVGIIIIGIAIFFNLLVNKYIKTSSNQKLNEAREIISSNEGTLGNGKQWNNHPEKNRLLHGNLGNFQEKVKKAKYQAGSQIIIVNSNYEITFPTADFDFYDEDDSYNEVYEEIITEVRNHNINLNSEKNNKITTNNGTYYISHEKISNLESEEEYYLILYINISDILMFAKEINSVLILIMVIAAIIAIITAIILSNKIAKPIQILGKFAKEIGEGNFNTCKHDFEDREIDELVKVMNKSAEELDNYDKDQKVFFQNVSHELRTPLMSIKGYAEAIKYNVLDNKSASEVILEESDRLIELIEELLYVSKIDNITKDYILGEYDLREILSNCTAKQKVRAINLGIEFIYDFDKDPVLFKCDEKSIYRAFLNIITNGLRYAKSRIVIVCKKKENGIVISIENDGEHIKEKDLPYIFERFYKGDKGKHGIGLSIVKSIINKHNGAVYVKNIDDGVRFKIILKI